VPWNGQRFRKVERNKEKMERKAVTKSKQAWENLFHHD
jgi:hypothetical protein